MPGSASASLPSIFRLQAAVARQLTCALLIAGLSAVAARAAEPAVATQWGSITEPDLPTTVCATLPAALTSKDGSVDAADADGKAVHPDQERLQAAIDGCAGGLVKLTAGTDGQDAFLTGPLTLKSGVILFVDKPVTLYASRDPKDYDKGAGDCGTANTSWDKTCKPLLLAKDTKGAGVAGEGKIDGRGGSLLLSGDNAGKRSWWDVAWQSKQGLNQHVFRLLEVEGGENFTLSRIALINSPNFHVVSNGVTGLTAWGIKILSPSAVYTKPDYACPPGTTPDQLTPATCFTPDTVKNTDGFDPGQSTKVLLAYSAISTGDDHVAIKAGGDKPSTRMTFAHNRFYYGHGLSIGSETNSGVDDIHVFDLVMDGHDSPEGNGLRIKSDTSRGGKVGNVLYEDICMRNVAAPLVFDTRYSDKTGDKMPDFSGITVRNMRYTGSASGTPGRIVLRGIRDESRYQPLSLFLDTVQFDGAPPQLVGSADPTSKDAPLNAAITLGPGPVSFADLLKADPARRVRVVNLIDAGNDDMAPPIECSSAFQPFSAMLEGAPI
ncbi:glycoside hydrolase family 28 protein [Allorhizobium taibaishanense]|uniref:Polygalacturonase n=1 Tax=Allorhizobium taibaishanense TaxID=887144 RepID=A0A1Q8ZZ50_9HYPH|nr:glycoside hydrolase family 28 protein [Allorhizobium taibaishanense]MBB4007428.1 polygalacturonase [Allorhizobium taibaishanense]OLP47615.1 polygalacturonase [Allorhizobium taibaishanense]